MEKADQIRVRETPRHHATCPSSDRISMALLHTDAAGRPLRPQAAAISLPTTRVLGGDQAGEMWGPHASHITSVRKAADLIKTDQCRKVNLL